jgi:molecular chaperone DnaK
LAGLKPVATITEPHAAALAYGLHEQATRPGAEFTVMVFDLGGGTFDVTLMKIAKREFHVIDSNGDPKLGGVDWDSEIGRLLKQEFEKRAGEEFDSVADKEDTIRLQKLSEDIKIQLSLKEEHRFMVEAAGTRFKMEMKRQDFEVITEHFVRQALRKCDELFQRTGYTWQRVDKILLVGSSTKMPMIQKAIQQASGKEPLLDKDPKLMVAKGAAIYGYFIREGIIALPSDQITSPTPSHRSDLEVREVRGATARGLGVLARSGEQELVKVLIPRNTPTPYSAEQTFTTVRDGATALTIPLYEGDSQNQLECSLIGDMRIDGLPPRPRGQPVKVKLMIDAAGCLEVEVQDLETGRLEKKKIDRSIIHREEKSGEPDPEARGRHLDELIIR